jgi:hypothetical protein
MVARYPVGSNVFVAVDPDNPDCSALESGMYWHMYGVLVASIVMMALGCFLLRLFYTHYP